MKYKKGQYVSMANSQEEADINYKEGDIWILENTTIGLCPKQVKSGGFCAGGLKSFAGSKWFIINKYEKETSDRKGSKKV